jgi:hypothetical protein
VWQNDQHFNTVLSKSYKDDDEWKDTDQLWIIIVRMVHQQISQSRQKMPQCKSSRTCELGCLKKQLKFGILVTVAVRTHCQCIHAGDLRG